MEKQVVIGLTKLDPALFRPVQNSFDIKPSGGLWSSPYTPGPFVSDWHQFAHEYLPHRIAEEAVLFSFRESARIYTIDGRADLKRLEETVGLISDPWNVIYRLNWEAAAVQWDAVYLTRQGQRETRFPDTSHIRTLEGWDVESVLTFRLGAIAHWETKRLSDLTR